jgi:hypothetical protein
MASAALLGATGPVMAGVSASADRRAITSLTAGVALVLGNLVPGMTVAFGIGRVASGTVVSVGGDWVNGTAGGTTVSLRSDARLFPAVLVPGVEYTARILGGQVMVTASV